MAPFTAVCKVDNIKWYKANNASQQDEGLKKFSVIWLCYNGLGTVFLKNTFLAQHVSFYIINGKTLNTEYNNKTCK